MRLIASIMVGMHPTKNVAVIYKEEFAIPPTEKPENVHKITDFLRMYSKLVLEQQGTGVTIHDSLLVAHRDYENMHIVISYLPKYRLGSVLFTDEDYPKKFAEQVSQDLQNIFLSRVGTSWRTAQNDIDLTVPEYRAMFDQRLFPLTEVANVYAPKFHKAASQAKFDTRPTNATTVAVQQTTQANEIVFETEPPTYEDQYTMRTARKSDGGDDGKVFNPIPIDKTLQLSKKNKKGKVAATNESVDDQMNIFEFFFAACVRGCCSQKTH
jgi:hypothetical protein